MKKPTIGVYYALARSGGTLVSRCIACITGNVLLSEVHPSSPHFNPLVQAAEWYGLVDDTEIFDCSNPDRYLAAIKLIHQRCCAKNLKLIIRDWSHIDFTPEIYNAGTPSYRLLQKEILNEYFDLKEVTMIRHPADYYLSLINLIEITKLRKNKSNDITLNHYLSGVRHFIEATRHAEQIRYEDFCQDPDSTMKLICTRLGINFDAIFIKRFGNYFNVTGDIYDPCSDHETLAGDSLNRRSNNHSICLPSRRPEFEKLRMEFYACEDYRWIIQALGFEL